MEYFLIISFTFIASILTFYSGFGLGTILMPVLALFFPLPIAIGCTALVHFFHNVVKLAILWKWVDWKIGLTFGFAAFFAAALGGWALTQLSGIKPLMIYSLFGIQCEVSFLHLLIGLLFLIFAIFEQYPNHRLVIKNPYVGGALSGFFGGLSGNQGAFRSMFLLSHRQSKEAYIATNAAIASAVDIMRLSVYSISFHGFIHTISPLLWLGTFGGAFMGICVGTYFLKKVTMRFVQNVVVILLYIFSLLLMLGIV